MNRKIIPLLIMLIIAVSCLSLVSADNNTTDNLTEDIIEEDIGENLTDYIIPLKITEKGIEFNDGFTGFALDSSKNIITTSDKFTSQKTTDEEVENYVKLAIIECYKTGHESNIQEVVSQVITGNKDYDIVESVYNSTETFDDIAVVNISNDTEATFTFEHLKSEDLAKSDCIAYTVSMKAIDNTNALAAANDESNDTLETATDNNTDNNDTTILAEDNATPQEQNISDVEKTTDNSTEKQDINESKKTTDNNTEKQDINESKKTTDNNTEKQTVNNTTLNDKQTTVNETNKTIINKTNTLIVNETNTTVVNKNITKVINKTKETPQNANVQNQIIKAVGNPIFLLVIIIAIIAIAAVIIRGKN